MADYANMRLLRVAKSFIDDEDPLMENVHEIRGKLRQKPRRTIGPFLKKYVELRNSDFETYFSKINIRKEKEQARHEILRFKHAWTATQQPQGLQPQPGRLTVSASEI